MHTSALPAGIPFLSRTALLARARSYVADSARFFAEQEHAVGIVVRALRCAPAVDRRTFITLLGVRGGSAGLRALVRLAIDPRQHATVRLAAARRVAASRPAQDGVTVARLLQALESQQAAIRVAACIALGWPGNSAAIAGLLGLVEDRDAGVSRAAIEALLVIGDPEVCCLLEECLSDAPGLQS